MNISGMTASYDEDHEMVVEEYKEHAENNYIKGGMFLFFILVFVILIIRFITSPGTFPIRSVRIEGEFRHLSPNVLKASVTDVVRGGFFDVNVETIQKALLKNPWVDKVVVLRVWPDGLKVQVGERIPVARWKDEGLLSSEAVFFTPDDKFMPENLPVFSGPENSYGLLLTRFEYLSEILTDKELEIRRLTLNDRRAWEFTLKNGIELFIGKGQFEKRINRFVNYVWPALKHDLSRISSIDMRYTNGFVISWNEIDEENLEMGKEQHG